MTKNKNKEEKKALAPPPPAIDDFEMRIRQLVEKGRRRGKRYSIIGITASILMALAVIGGGYYLLTEVINLSEKTDEKIEMMLKERPSGRVFILNQWRTCTQDEDCVETQAGCCDCGHGGRQTAINRRYLSRWQKVLTEKCGNISCVAVVVCRTGQAVCEQGKCQFKKGRP
jgi:hypothetical protein